AAGIPDWHVAGSVSAHAAGETVLHGSAFCAVGGGSSFHQRDGTGDERRRLCSWRRAGGVIGRAGVLDRHGGGNPRRIRGGASRQLLAAETAIKKMPLRITSLRRR